MNWKPILLLVFLPAGWRDQAQETLYVKLSTLGGTSTCTELRLIPTSLSVSASGFTIEIAQCGQAEPRWAGYLPNEEWLGGSWLGHLIEGSPGRLRFLLGGKSQSGYSLCYFAVTEAEINKAATRGALLDNVPRPIACQRVSSKILERCPFSTLLVTSSPESLLIRLSAGATTACEVVWEIPTC